MVAILAIVTVIVTVNVIPASLLERPVFTFAFPPSGASSPA